MLPFRAGFALSGRVPAVCISEAGQSSADDRALDANHLRDQALGSMRPCGTDSSAHGSRAQPDPVVTAGFSVPLCQTRAAAEARQKRSGAPKRPAVILNDELI